MNGSVSSPPLFPRLVLAFVGALLFACSGEQDAVSPAAPPIWPDQDLVAVAVTAEDRALVVGMSGAIYRTSDAGDSWQLAHVPVVSSLRAIVMADDQRGWVVGDGVILRTDDGGARWRRQRLPGPSASMRLLAVGAVDAAHAVVVGADGIILQTGDGGGSWVDISRPAGDTAMSFGARRDVACRHDSGGPCWSAGRGLERVGGRGESRESELFDDYSTMPAIDFDLEQVEMSGPSKERLERFVVENRQRTNLDWILESGLSPLEADTIGGRRDPSAVFDLIEARLQEVRTVIEEAGIPPERIIVLGEPPWDYEDYLDEDAHVLARYWKQRIDLGSGLRVFLRDHLALESLGIGDSGLVLAVGRSGAIVRSDDGGGHWQVIRPSTPHDLYAVGIGRRRAVAVGAQGGLWTSVDEGRNWEPAPIDVETDFFDTLRGVSFSPSGGIGFVVGEKGRILRSLDGGETWAELGVR